MGYMIVIGDCVACRRRIQFNPYRVPSIRVHGEREPLCEACARRWNLLHPEQARPILPGAYDPIGPEDEEPWEDEA